ncbi:hypothetical protein SDC9_199624 [bioreactor metagenome]|uniref:Uncharacterized protein n=1 Tax=bioreactor metagenome TaxID=1076179 RepID=A0A645IMA1_9ZZZZ
MNIKNLNVGNILIKSVGAAGLGLIAYDSHAAGKINSASYQKQVKAGGLTNAYMDTLTLNSPSVVQSKIKDKYFKFRMYENVSDFFTGIAGYAKGFGSMVANNVVPLALSAATLMTKGTVSKVFGAGLLAYGGLFFGREVLGIGKPNAL